jgi:hypothetical protein
VRGPACAHIRLGNPDAGDALVERMQHKAAGDNNLIPEMYVSRLDRGYPGPIGAPADSIPMMGYGAGSYILYLMERRPGGLTASSPDRGFARLAKARPPFFLPGNRAGTFFG